MALNITSTPTKTATEGTGYSYSPTTDGTPVNWDLTGAPSGMLFSHTTGRVDWTPSYDRTNSGSLHLFVRDSSDQTATQDWTIAVSFVTPSITNSPDTTATEGTGYRYIPTATVVDFYKYDLTGAPTGMTVDATTGRVDWTPSYDRTNSGNLTLTLRSLNDLTDHKDWTIAVNFVTPSITNSPDTTATEHIPYSYTPTATVVDFYKYDLTGAPTGMTVDATTGRVDWTPSYDRTNSGNLTLTLRSLNGLTDHKDWTVAVTMIAPTITSTPGKTATEGSLYSYTPTKTAQDFSYWTLNTYPTGMTVDATTGVVSWVPNYDQTNSGNVRLRIYDLNGLTAYQDWTVASSFVQPQILSTPDTTAYVNRTYSYSPTKIVAYQDTWTLNRTVFGMVFDPVSGAITWTPDADQTTSGTLILTLRALNGLRADQTFTITVLPEPDSAEVSGSVKSGMISPYGVSYSVTDVWTFDHETHVPTGIRQNITIS